MYRHVYSLHQDVSFPIRLGYMVIDQSSHGFEHTIRRFEHVWLFLNSSSSGSKPVKTILSLFLFNVCATLFFQISLNNKPLTKKSKTWPVQINSAIFIDGCSVLYFGSGCHWPVAWPLVPYAYRCCLLLPLPITLDCLFNILLHVFPGIGLLGRKLYCGAR